MLYYIYLFDLNPFNSFIINLIEIITVIIIVVSIPVSILIRRRRKRKALQKKQKPIEIKKIKIKKILTEDEKIERRNRRRATLLFGIFIILIFIL